jgi:hypothetical protein
MDFLRTYGKELVSVAVPVLSAVVTWLSRARVRLTCSTPHGFTFLVQQPLRDPQGNVITPTQTVHTRSFWFRNDGRATAHNVEIVFNYQPLCLNVWPSRHFEVRVEPDGRYTLTFATLAPKENLGCELLNVNIDLPGLVTVRCDEELGRDVPMYPQPVVARWRAWVVLVLAFLGLVSAIYLILIGLQWLILKTPTVL